MSDDPRVHDLLRLCAEGQIDRRQLLRRAVGLGLSASAVATLLAQSGGGVSAATRLASAAQGDASTLVVADNMSSGGLWLMLDPGQFYEINPGPLMNVVYETLYHLPDSAKPEDFEPLLAQGMPEVSADGKEVTIKVRSGVKFHTTGNEMTADDWVFSLNRTKNLKGNPSYLAEYWTSVEAVDASTLKFTLEAPNPALVAILTSTPLAVVDSKQVIANGGSDATPPASGDPAGAAFQEGSLGTGPYILTQYDPNTEVIIERNADYWGDVPAFDRMIWRNIVSANEQLQAVQTGDADIAFSLDPDAVDQVKNDANLQLLEGQTISLHYLALHTQDEPGGPLAKKEMRQAIARAIDYDGIVDGLLSGAAIRPATVVPIPMPGSEEVQAEAYTLDIAEAQKLFEAAGTGPVEITLSYPADGEGPSGLSAETLATKLQSDLQEIKGLTVKLEPMDANTWIADYRASSLQFTLAPWGPDYPDIQSYTEPFGRSDQGVAKRVGYKNPTVDETLDQIVTETDPAKKEELFVAVQRTMIDDAAFIVLYQPTDRKPASATVKNVKLHYLYGIQLRYATKSA